MNRVTQLRPAYAGRGSVRVAVVGAGERGCRLAGDVMTTPGAELSALCDRSMAALTRRSPEFPGLAMIGDFSGVLEDPAIEAVVVATPLSSRYRIATASLAAGKHVFVTDALAASHREAADLQEFAQRLGLVLMPGHRCLYSPRIGYVRSLIESGQLGEVFFVSSSRADLGRLRADTSIVWDMASSDLATLLHLIDELPSAVSASGSASVVPGKADIVVVTLRYPSNRIAHLELSRLTPSRLDRTTVVGSNKMVVCEESLADPVRVFETGISAAEFPAAGSPRVDTRAGDILVPLIEGPEPGALQMTDFISSIAHGTTPRSNTRVGVEVVRLIEEVERHLSAGAA